MEKNRQYSVETNIIIKEDENENKYKYLKYELRTLYLHQTMMLVVLVIQMFIGNIKKALACIPLVEFLALPKQSTHLRVLGQSLTKRQDISGNILAEMLPDKRRHARLDFSSNK